MHVLYKYIQIVSLFLYIKTLGEKTIQTVIIISSHCRVTEGFKELYKNKFSIVNVYDFFNMLRPFSVNTDPDQNSS